MPHNFTVREVRVKPGLGRRSFTHRSVQIHHSADNLAGMKETDIKETICVNFLRLCEATGLQKKQFVEPIPMSPQQLSNVAIYRNPPSPYILAETSRIYGIPVDFFYFGTLSGIRDEKLAQKLRELSASGWMPKSDGEPGSS